MTKRLNIAVMILVLIGAQLLPGHAAQERVDFLIGLGGFERCTDFRWQSGYSGSDYDWVANSGWVGNASASGWRSGYNTCTPDDSVAVGWRRLSGTTVNPGLHQVYRLADGQGILGSKAQYVALRNCSGSAYTMIRHDRRVYPSLANEPRAGDTLVFRIDSVRMVGFDALSVRSVIAPTIQLQVISGTGSQSFSVPVAPSETSATVEVSAVLPSGVTEITVGFKLDINADLTGKELGAYLDGAHIYIKRASTPSEFATWEIPAPKPRSIKSMLKIFVPSKHDVYETAQNYDYILSGDSLAIYNEQFRAIDPDVKIFLYKTSVIVDYSYGSGVDPWYIASPIGFIDASTNHPEWMYSDGKGGYIHQTVYADSVYARLDNTAYQNAWAEKAKTLVLRHGFDGLFLDELNTIRNLTVPENPVYYSVSMLQHFLHSVLAQFRAAGIVTQRNGIMSFTSGQGLVLNNPWFAKTTPYNTNEYLMNTPDSVTDSFFQEWAFFGLNSTGGVYDRNTYDSNFWWEQIKDMDRLVEWNTGGLLPDNRKKTMVMHSYGLDRPGDPAYGTTGWMQFALASYLLAQNDYTVFGTMERYDDSKLMDYSITKLLGSPAGAHQAISGDTYFRYREYGPTADGGRGGVVVVNANTTSRNYTLGFDAVDESGSPLPAGTVIDIPPHVGRILINREARLVVNVSTSTSEAKPGEQVVFTVEYANDGTHEIRNAVVQASVPVGMSFVAMSAGADGSYSASTRVVSWTIPTVGPLSGGTRQFRATVQ